MLPGERKKKQNYGFDERRKMLMNGGGVKLQ